MKIALDKAFEKAVIREFGFLVTNYGFVLSREDDLCILYSSEKVRVQICHGVRSFHVECRLRLARDTDRDYFPLGFLSDVYPKIIDELQWYKVADTPEQVDRYVAEIANFLNRNGAEVLLGNEDVFSLIKNTMKADVDLEIRRNRAAVFRPLAEEAFRKRDFEKVVRYYREFEESLTKVERKKLSYAKSKLLG